jgi:hypothetical protein
LGVAGKRNTMVMKNIQTTAVTPIGRLYCNEIRFDVPELCEVAERLASFPSVNAPGRKSFLKRNRHAIGREYATYCPVTPSAKIAPIAPGPAKARRPRR